MKIIMFSKLIIINNIFNINNLINIKNNYKNIYISSLFEFIISSVKYVLLHKFLNNFFS